MMKIVLMGLCLLFASLGGAVLAQDISEKPNKKVVILLGPPGSGKGTQAVRLTKELGIPHISTGDLFRENISKNTELGQRAKSYMDAGKLVPDELVLDMLFDRVSRPDCSKGYLLDGFPRTLTQAEALGKHLEDGTDLSVLELQVPDELIVKRVAGRLTCQSCGAIYNRHFTPPANEGVCDKCQGQLVQRSDDTEQVVNERLRVYHSQTSPLIDYYKKQGKLRSVDGTQTPDAVYQELIKDLKD